MKIKILPALGKVESITIRTLPGCTSDWKEHITHTLYMKRGDAFYFKTSIGRVILDVWPMPDELSKLKYGDEVTFEFDYKYI